MIFFTKILITLIFLTSTGGPLIWLHKIILPSYIYIVSISLLILIFCCYFHDFFRLKKEVCPWIIALIIVLLTLLRKNFIPPYNFKIYDFLLLFISLSLIYKPSKIKELFIFSSILLCPLSLTELYGFMPSSVLSAILLGASFAGALILQHFSSHINISGDPKLVDILLLLGLGILLGVFSLNLLVFQKGELKDKRVIFDIGHGNTESPYLAFNTNLNSSSSHGHAKLMEFLMNYGFKVDLEESMTQESLNRADILVLIMPSQPYTAKEISDIKEFVSKGGGLLVIGDHTDMDNSSFSLNPVIGQFGINFLFDTIWLRSNSRQDLRYRPHPIIFGLKKVNIGIGASLKTKFPAKSIIQSSYAVYSDYGDPNNMHNSFLGNSKLDKNEKMHDLILIAESRYGRGRVLVLGDSVCFQNTSLYMNRLFAYRIFTWLNHRVDNTSYRKISLSIIFLLLILTSLLLILKRKRLALNIIFAIMGFYLIAAIWIGGIVNNKVYSGLERLEDTILIDMAHKNEYGVYWIIGTDSDTALNGLISQIIRLGYHPIIKTSGHYTLDELLCHKALIVVSPNIPFSKGEIEAVAKYCEDGGGLLLIEGARKWACSDPLWERFNLFKEPYPLSADNPILSPLSLPMRLPYGNFNADFIYHPIIYGIFGSLRMVNPCRIKGGLPVAFVYGEPVMNILEIGEGRIIAIGDDRIFASYLVEKDSMIIDREKIKLIWNIIYYLTNG